MTLINAVRMQQAEAQKARRAIEAEEDVGTCDGSCDEPLGFENRKCGRTALSVQEDATQQSQCNIPRATRAVSKAYARQALAVPLCHMPGLLESCKWDRSGSRLLQVGSAASGSRLL